MKTHKRNKRTRLRGSRSAGTGFRKKKKGHGNKGGHGWSGTTGQKMQLAQMRAKEMGFKTYFGSRGLTSAPTGKKKTKQINLDDIKANMFTKDGEKINLDKYKILGDGIGFKAEIYAKSATASAIEKMEKAGGKIIVKEKNSSEKKVEETKKVEVKKIQDEKDKKTTAKKTSVAKKNK